MAVETNVITTGEQKDDGVMTTTTVTEKMSTEKFLASYAQREGQMKQIKANLEVLEGMLKDIEQIKKEREPKKIKELLDKILRPDKLIEQKEALLKSYSEQEKIVTNLKPLFDKLRAENAEKAKKEEEITE